MEEPPKIERLISSRGISLSDAATILKSYVAIIDHHYAPRKSPANDTSDPTDSNDINTDGNPKSSSLRQDLLAEEKEEQRLLARLNQLDPSSSTNNRLGSISEDVYERLQRIMESVVGEAEGRVVSAVSVYADTNTEGEGLKNEGDASGGQVDGQDEFMKELEEAEQLQQSIKEEEEEPPQQQVVQEAVVVDYEQKKKDKKAKKAAKKAKKEAKKRRASGGGDGAIDQKRIKVE